jgi:hypothetical protein
MSTLDDAVLIGFEAARAVSGEDVIFRCDLGELNLSMIPALSEMQLSVDEGQTRYEAKDFLVPADELVFDGVKIEPARGNSVVFNGRVWQVLTERDSPGFRYMDHAERLVRIHTKHVDDEACE